MSESHAQPMTYGGQDVLEFMEMIDPHMVGVERLVRSLRQASAGVERAKLYTIGFVREHRSRLGCDPYALDDELEAWWDEGAPAEDLREIAREQAEGMRSAAFEFRLSDAHPTKAREVVDALEEHAESLAAWSARSRRDALEMYSEQAEKELWPTRLVYEQKHGAKNARHFLACRPDRVISSEGVPYSFERGIWTETSDDRLEAEVRATDPTDVLDVDNIRKVVKGVHHLTAVEARPFEWLDSDSDEPVTEDLALFRNGLLNVRTGVLIPHDGRFFATGLPEHDYDPLAGCPAWTRWLEETLDPSFHPTLQEWFGYCLTPDTRAHSFMNLLGGTRSGKSTAHNALRALVGRQHTASAMMPDLGSDFGMQAFLDKRLVIVPDAHDAPTRNRAAALERIKSITGGDEVSVNRKNLPILTAQLKARILITCNRLPKFIDESGALAARMLVVRFDRSFKGREDRGLGDRLRVEMSGIANWAIEGLWRLRENSLQFTVGDLGYAEVEDAARSHSPALRFAESRLTVTGDQEDFAPMADIYQAYQDWACTEGLGRYELRNQNDLGHDIRAALPNVQYTQRRRGGRRIYGLSGVSRVELDFGGS
jgi:P4 family phage/plasmid primase-like protien